MGKRKERENDDGPVRSAELASIGQLTSHIANKQRRSEEYGKLKHKKEVRTAVSTEGLFRLNCLQHSPAMQKAKRAERTKRQAAAAKAEELGLEAPPRKITKVACCDLAKCLSCEVL